MNVAANCMFLPIYGMCETADANLETLHLKGVSVRNIHTYMSVAFL